jgi:hypothetical protein
MTTIQPLMLFPLPTSGSGFCQAQELRACWPGNLFLGPSLALFLGSIGFWLNPLTFSSDERFLTSDRLESRKNLENHQRKTELAVILAVFASW